MTKKIKTNSQAQYSPGRIYTYAQAGCKGSLLSNPYKVELGAICLVAVFFHKLSKYYFCKNRNLADAIYFYTFYFIIYPVLQQ